LAFVCCEDVFRFVTSKLEMCTHPLIITGKPHSPYVWMKAFRSYF